MKLCECGCGAPAPIATMTARRFGWKVGEPVRFVQGHNMRVHKAQRYRRSGDSYVHRMRAESALGRQLPHGAEVHHMDGTKDADAPLVICPSRAYHGLLHQRTRVFAAGGDPNTQRICCICKQLQALELMRGQLCIVCKREYDRRRNAATAAARPRDAA